MIFPKFIQESAFFLIPVGVFSQWFFRLLFVKGYHVVEDVISSSIHTSSNNNRQRQGNGRRNNNNENDNNATTPTENGNAVDEALLFRLELNDWACGIASGVGFGGMHATMLYGTLLSSEASSMGTLYQDSCPSIPSVTVSAINAFLFSILDIVLMLISFYGMRLLSESTKNHHVNDSAVPATGGSAAGQQPTSAPTNQQHIATFSDVTPSTFGEIMDSRRPYFYLASTLVLHLSASFSTSFNIFDYGCIVSLPLTFIVVVSAVLFFLKFISLDRYLPENQRRTDPSRHID